MPYKAYGFVDGGYLRALAKAAGMGMVNPRKLVTHIVSDPEVQSWASSPLSQWNAVTGRVIYYDGRPDDEAEVSANLQGYWDAVELLPDTELGFGSVRGGGRRRPPRQKGVDTLIAVHMLVGAFTGIYDVGVLIAGDADFVPVVREVRRRGVMVVLAAATASVSEELRRAADRFIPIGPDGDPKLFPPLLVNKLPFAAE